MLTDINQETEKIEGNSQQKQAILKLIEIKTDSDMKEVIAKMEGMQIAIDTKFSSLKSEITILKWLIGIVVALLTAVLTLKG